MDNRNDGNDKNATNGGEGNKPDRSIIDQLLYRLLSLLFACIATILLLAKGNAIGVPLLVCSGIVSGIFASSDGRVENLRKNRRFFFELLCTIAAYTMISIIVVPNPPEFLISPAVSVDYIARVFLLLFEVVIVYIGGAILGGVIRTLR